MFLSNVETLPNRDKFYAQICRYNEKYTMLVVTEKIGGVFKKVFDDLFLSHKEAFKYYVENY